MNYSILVEITVRRTLRFDRTWLGFSSLGLSEKMSILFDVVAIYYYNDKSFFISDGRGAQLKPHISFDFSWPAWKRLYHTKPQLWQSIVAKELLWLLGYYNLTSSIQDPTPSNIYFLGNFRQFFLGKGDIFAPDRCYFSSK